MDNLDIPVMQNFCCLFSLRVGCLFMGVLNAVLNMAVAILLIICAVDIKEAANNGKIPDEMISVIYPMVIFLIVLLVAKFMLDMVFVIIVVMGLRHVMSRFFLFWTVFLALLAVGFMKTMFHMERTHVLVEVIYMAQNVFYIIVVRSYLMSLEEE